MIASRNNNFLAICFCVPLFFSLDQLVQAAGPVSTKKDMVKVGVIIDQNSTVGKMASRYIDMALSDFYEEHEGYRTMLFPCARDPQNDVVAAASAALDLIENEQVDAIIGPQWSSQAKFVVDLGAKAQVPIISFSATSPSLSPTQNQYFVRTAYDDIFQVKAISAIVQAFGWRKVVLIYEDTEYGNGLVPCIMDAFQEIDTWVPFKSAIPPSAQEFDILSKLVEVMTMQTRVFLVHMTASLGSRLFMQAKKAGMLNEETVWIVTDGLTSLLDPVEYTAVDSMQGVIGVRPYLHRSKRLVRWMKKYSMVNRDINLFGLWAYDTVWALGDAVEKAWNSSKFRHTRRTTTRTTPNADTAFMNFSALGISEVGPKILRRMRNLKVNGLTGHFHLRSGQLSHSAFEVFNVVDHEEQVIGYWTRKYGLSSKIPNRFNKKEKGYSTSINDLKAPIWPGGTRRQPRGWVMPAVKGSKMRIGVPRTCGFTEIFKIEWDPRTEVPAYSGFSYDVFLEVLKRLPFAIDYEFKPFVNASRQSAGTYDDMLDQIKLEEVDAVVGDTTNTAERSTKVDFTTPYLHSGVSMLVAIKDDERRNMWIFLKPLKWDLWLTTGLAFMFTGFVVWTLERRRNEDFNGSPSEQLGRSLWFSFSTLVFAHREKVTSNWTRLVLVIWVFVVLILTQSYTASLASFLTVHRLQPKYIDAQDLVRSQHFVGYQGHSFVRDFLILEMKFSETRLIPYGSAEEYRDALDSGSVAAIFDEIPYINLFLAKYCNKYTMVGPTYKTAGFSFAFPMGSPLVSYFSRAVLNVTQDKATMDPIERKYFPSQTSSCQDTTDQGASISSDLSLSVYSFGGLFIITGVASLSAILAEFFYSNWRRLFSPAWITSGVPTDSSSTTNTNTNHSATELYIHTPDPIERKYFPSQTSSCQGTTDRGASISSDLSLSVYSFGGLFIITGVASLSAILAELFHSNCRRLFSPAWITSGVPTDSSSTTNVDTNHSATELYIHTPR